MNTKTRQPSLDPSGLGAPALLVDAASPSVQTALWHQGKWIHWSRSNEEAGRGLFRGVEALLQTESLAIGDLGGFFFCEGPGSMLGIRIAAMALRGWQSLLSRPLPVFSYRSHDLLAFSLLAERTEPPFHIISDARRDSWNVTSIASSGAPEPVRRIASPELAELPGAFFRMEETIRAHPPGASAPILPYSLESQAELFLVPGLLRSVENADPLTLEAPDYKKWNAERHR